MTSDLPKYVERGGEQIFPPPWTITDGDFYGFLVATDQEAVQQRICDPLFNIPMNEPGRFKPAGDFVMIVYNNLPKLVSTAPGWASKGVLAEHEMAFWSLLHDTTANRIFWTQSYMVVNRGRAVSTGREVFGFPKEYGWITLPQSSKDPSVFTTETIVVPKFTTDEVERRGQIVSVKKTAPGDPARELGSSLWGALKTGYDVMEQSHGLLDGVKLIWNTLTEQAHMQVPMVFLKQFRDITDPSRAAFQAITEAPTVLTKLNHGRLYFDKFEIEIADFDSHPICQDFGLSSPMSPTLSFWINMNFVVEPGVEIWRSCPKPSS